MNDVYERWACLTSTPLQFHCSVFSCAEEARKLKKDNKYCSFLQIGSWGQDFNLELHGTKGRGQRVHFVDSIMKEVRDSGVADTEWLFPTSVLSFLIVQFANRGSGSSFLGGQVLMCGFVWNRP